MALLLTTASGTIAVAEEIREELDAQGRLLRSLTVENDTILSETTFRYDMAGRILEKVIRRQSEVTRELNTYLPSGKLSRREVYVGDTLTTRKIYHYERDRIVSESVEAADGTRKTTQYSYDIYGRLILRETALPSGIVETRKVLTYPSPAVPITGELDLGGSYQSDVDITELSVGFSFARVPPIERYGTDPLELKLSGAYRLGRSRDTDTIRQLTGAVSIDYNYILPWTTVFFFANLERNPVANLDLGLNVALLGGKLDLTSRDPLEIAISFAPVWDYRVITNQSEVVTVFRGSFRLRSAFRQPDWRLFLQLEYAPELNPAGGNFEIGWTSRAILRTTGVFVLKLNEYLSLKEELRSVWDQGLIDQAEDCSATSASTLCEGYRWSTLTSLSFQFDVRR